MRHGGYSIWCRSRCESDGSLPLPFAGLSFVWPLETTCQGNDIVIDWRINSGPVLLVLYCILVIYTTNAAPIRWEDFDGKSVALSGKGWTVAKHLEKDDHGNETCFVRIEAAGKTIHDVAASPNTGWTLEEQDWTRFYIYNTPDGLPDLLAIVWFSGGAHGPVNLRIVALGGEFPMVFNFDRARFSYLEDLNGDGMPEAILNAEAFDGFYRSAINFSHVDSPFPLLVSTYDASRKRYMWANELFPEVLEAKETASKERFLKDWPSGDKIPVDIALDQYAKAADAYRKLMCWAADACYARGQAAAVEIIEAHADPILAVFAKHAFITTLWDAPNFNFMKNNPISR